MPRMMLKPKLHPISWTWHVRKIHKHILCMHFTGKIENFWYLRWSQVYQIIAHTQTSRIEWCPEFELRSPIESTVCDHMEIERIVFVCLSELQYISNATGKLWRIHMRSIA
jgi:hypothetical protein